MTKQYKTHLRVRVDAARIAKLQEAAKQGGRTLTGEITNRLDGSFRLDALRLVLGNQMAMMCALHQLSRGFLSPDPLGQARLSECIQATRELIEGSAQ